MISMIMELIRNFNFNLSTNSVKQIGLQRLNTLSAACITGNTLLLSYVLPVHQRYTSLKVVYEMIRHQENGIIFPGGTSMNEYIFQGAS